jgi:hypothetical protein
MTRISRIKGAVLAACRPSVLICRRRIHRSRALRAALAGYREMAALRLIGGSGMTDPRTRAATSDSANVKRIASLVDAGSVPRYRCGRVR